MPQKLEPEQIGTLAGMIQSALRQNPEPKMETNKPAKSQTTMSEWEKALRTAVNTCPSLPSYNKIFQRDTPLVEFLIDYYGEQ